MFCDPNSIIKKLTDVDDFQQSTHLHYQPPVVDLMCAAVMTTGGDVVSYADFSDKCRS